MTPELPAYFSVFHVTYGFESFLPTMKAGWAALRTKGGLLLWLLELKNFVAEVSLSGKYMKMIAHDSQHVKHEVKTSTENHKRNRTPASTR